MTGSYKQLRRGDHGVTITWEHRATGELHSAHTAGEPRLEALRAALDGWDATEWRIRCISTPQTIYDDLIGRRSLRTAGDLHYGDVRGSDTTSDMNGARTPERTLLAYVGGTAFL